MGIRSKQLTAGTFAATVAGRAPFGAGLFDSTTADSVFATASIADAKLVETYIQADGSIAFSADQPMGTNKLTGLADGTVATDAVNKGQLDSAIAGLDWAPPVDVREFVGSATIAAIDGLTPTQGDAYLALDAGTPAAGTSDALVIGSIAEYDGVQWKEIVAGSGGFAPAGTRALASVQTALNGTLSMTDGVDDAKYLDFDGLTNDPVKSTPLDGAAVLVAGDGGTFENKAYVFDGVVPTGTWIQFSAATGTTARQESIPTEAISTDIALSNELTFTPESDESVSLFLNGIQQEQGATRDYVMIGTQINWKPVLGTAVDLEGTDVLIAYYRS